VVVIDTEEEFDWSAGKSRGNVSVRSVRHLEKVQSIFDEYDICPVFVVDYPVVSQPDGYRLLQELHASGRCLIGAHLHPWVNPPFEEIVTTQNSFPGNLPRSIEIAKLKILGDCIGERFGRSPVMYKAGRYGVGENTAVILEELGYEIDASICPLMDYSDEGGPDFTRSTSWPYWFGRERQLLELPLTVGFSGALRRWGKGLRRLASSPVLRSVHAVGALARLRLADRVWLSPEGYSSDEHQRLARALFEDGLRIFSFTFHSPSLEPGHTPYVQSTADLEQFLSRFQAFFDFFFGELGGCSSTPIELKSRLADNPSERPQSL
jgi:hypothetical protein